MFRIGTEFEIFLSANKDNVRLNLLKTSRTELFSSELNRNEIYVRRQRT
jgi:hypothetical protein